MAVHIAPHEIGVPFEARPVSLDRKETRTPAIPRPQSRRVGSMGFVGGKR
jgi:hypothetical protein